MEALWNQMVDSFPYGDRWFFTLMFCISHSCFTLPVNAVALFFHFFPSLVAHWKIQPEGNPSARLIKELVITNVVDHFITSPLLAYFILFPISDALGMQLRGPFPPLTTVAVQFVVNALIMDFLFYWAHRFFHTPWLYRHIHSKHHRWTSPISGAAEFAHPVEVIFANSIPTLIGGFLQRMHIFYFSLWIAIRMLETLDAHSGFDLPFSPWRYIPGFLGPHGHDWHHSHNRGNFGIFKFWDWAMGTDKEYHKWLNAHDSVPAQAKAKED